MSNQYLCDFLAVIAFATDTAMSKWDDREWGLGMMWYYLVVNVLDTLLWFAGMIVLMWYSRHREYEADAGSAHFVGKHAMIASLEKLKKLSPHTKVDRDEFATLKISAWDVIGFLSSHPSFGWENSETQAFP